MKKVLPTLEDYYEVIQSLPLKSKYTKEELMIPELLVKAEKTVEIYYAAHILLELIILNRCIDNQ